MTPLPPTASDEEILDVVRAWVGLLAADRYDAALDHIPSLAYWTPALLRTVVASCGSPDPEDDRGCRITPIDTASDHDKRPSHDVERFDEARVDDVNPAATVIGYVWFDLPLDGAWSDLTATFDVLADASGLTLRLDDVHVH